MTMQAQRSGGGYLNRPAPSGLADVVEIILDKGIVIDAYVRVSLVGIELLTVDARIVIASVDTYLRFAEAVNRLDLTETELAGLPELTGKTTKEVAKGKVEGAVEGVKETVTPDDGSGLSKAAKGAVAAAAVGAAAAAAREIARRSGGDSNGSDDG
jgi:gas vesicle structural protein